MKYIAILDSDDELSEDTINELKEIVFVGDEKTPYCFDITSIKEESKALEQESVLDKINAEIQKLRGCSCGCSDGIIDDVEDIIDKYKEEMESK